MKVLGTIRREIEIDPKDVIQNLIELKIDRRDWIYEEDGKYYRGYWTGGGSHSWEDKEEIDKSLYDYISALQLVLKTLTNEGK